MCRPRKTRYVSTAEEGCCFGPMDCCCSGEEVALTFDELEAIKLVYIEGLYFEDAAAKLGVSRQTIGRIIASAHRKVTEAIVSRSILRISDADFVECRCDSESEKDNSCVRRRRSCCCQNG